MEDKRAQIVETGLPREELKLQRYQFLLNYLSKPNVQERFVYIQKEYALVEDFEEIFIKHLIPTL